MQRVVAHVGDGDATLATGGDVDGAVAGGRDRDEPEIGQRTQYLAREPYLVGDGDGGAGQARHDLVRRGFVVIAPGVRKGRRAESGAYRRAVEKNNMFHWAQLM